MCKRDKRQTVKNKLSFNFIEFFIAYFLWVFGILINAIPIIYNCIKMLVANSELTFFQLFWTNQDFLFISFSTVFLLLLELILLRTNTNPKKLLEIVLACYGFMLIMIYSISFFEDNITNYFSYDFIMDFNKTTLIFTFLLGTIGFIYSFISKEREVSRK